MIRKIILLMTVMWLCVGVAQAAMTNHYVSATGTGTLAQSTNIDTPTSLTTALLHAVAGDYWWIKAGTYARSGNDLLVNSGGTNSPIIFEGYSVTPGDGNLGRNNGSGRLITTNMPTLNYGSGYKLTLSGDLHIVKYLKITASVNSGAIDLSYNCCVYGCRVENSYSGTAVAAVRLISAGATAENTDAYCTGSTNSVACFYCSATYTTISGCYAKNSSTSGGGCYVFIAASGSIKNSIADTGYGIGINFSGAISTIFDMSATNNTIYGQSGAGIAFPNRSVGNIGHVNNNIISNCAYAFYNAYGATAAPIITGSNNLTYNNTSADYGMFDSQYNINGISSDPQFVNAAVGDFRLKSTSPAIGAGVNGVNIGVAGCPLPTLPTAGQVQSGVTFGYLQDGLTTGTYSSGGINIRRPWRFGN